MMEVYYLDIVWIFNALTIWIENRRVVALSTATRTPIQCKQQKNERKKKIVIACECVDLCMCMYISTNEWLIDTIQLNPIQMGSTDYHVNICKMENRYYTNSNMVKYLKSVMSM